MDLLEELVGWIRTYFDALPSPLVIAGIVIGAAGPFLHLATGKIHKWSSPQTVLLGWALLPFGVLIALWLLGVVLHEWAPSKFEAWRNAGQGSNATEVFLYAALIAPVALAVSSVGYGMLLGWKGLPLALLGLVGAFALGWFTFMGLVMVACHGWASCP